MPKFVNGGEQPLVLVIVGPTASGKSALAIKIAKKHNKSVAQIILRWDWQIGVITIPKSVHKERIEENADIFDFELSDEDMTFIDSLNKNE